MGRFVTKSAEFHQFYKIIGNVEIVKKVDDKTVTFMSKSVKTCHFWRIYVFEDYASLNGNDTPWLPFWQDR